MTQEDEVMPMAGK